MACEGEDADAGVEMKKVAGLGLEVGRDEELKLNVPFLLSGFSSRSWLCEPDIFRLSGTGFCAGLLICHRHGVLA